MAAQRLSRLQKRIIELLMAEHHFHPIFSMLFVAGGRCISLSHRALLCRIGGAPGRCFWAYGNESSNKPIGPIQHHW